MTTNEIQELLSGELTDSRATELLHILSVSPEKRDIFLQHLRLNNAMQSDRYASMLSATESNDIWQNIDSAILPRVPSVTRVKFPFKKIAYRLGSMVTAGVVGYILGTTTLFNSNNNSLNGSASNISAQPDLTKKQDAKSINYSADNSTQISRNVGGLHLNNSHTPQNKPENEVSTNIARKEIAGNASSQKVKIVYRDRIIKEKIYSQESNTKESKNVATNSLQAAQILALQTTTDSLNKLFLQERILRSNLETDLTNKKTELDNLASKVKNENTKNENMKNENVKNENVKSLVVQERLKKDETQNQIEIKAEESPLSKNGVELSFSERVGFITPKPKAVANADLEFSNRSLGAAYRLLDGKFGVGGRALFGTLSTVSLTVNSATETGIPETEPKISADKKLWFEAFMNYRYPLSRVLALELEASYGGSSNSHKMGTDLALVVMLSNNFGFNIGGGFAQYTYDLSSSRAELKKQYSNIGISSDVLDKYVGNMLEARYGAFFRF